jgi:leucyl aminopeptidase (aminopeptidase T)
MGPGSTATPILGIIPLYGEVATAPRQGSESGVLMIDGPSQMGVRPATELDRQPLRIEVVGGKAVRWTGDAEQVARLEAFLAVGEPAPYYTDEVGIPTSRVMDNDRYYWSDGTHHLERVHIALGNNLRRESRVHGARHMDLEVGRPTITLDGTMILQDARMVGPLVE